MSDKFMRLDDGDGDVTVYGHSGDVKVQDTELEALLRVDGDVALIVKGNLHVEGQFSIDAGQQFQIDGNVTCDSFWSAGDGVLECNDLIVKRWVEIASDDDEMFETLEIDSVKAPIVVSRHMDPTDLPNASFDFQITDVDEEEEKLDAMLKDEFDALLTALKGGVTIDDAWLAEQ